MIGSSGMKSLTIQNRKQQRIAVDMDINPDAIGLGFVMHGLGGFKDQVHIQTFAKALKDKGYSVITFDTTNTLGESDGSYEDATLTNYYEDLEDVINWAKNQDWYIEPFVLIGHSLGSISAILYTESHPEEVKALAPISTAVSGELVFQTPYFQKILPSWKETGWLKTESVSKPGMIKALKYSPHVADLMKYNILPDVHKLTMPVLFAVGEKDTTTPLETQKMVYEKVSGPKELHVIKGASHTFREKKHLDELYGIITKWLGSV